MQKLYELKLTPNQVLLRVPPPADGAKANLSDIQKELAARGIGYRHDVLFEIYRRSTGQFEPLATRENLKYEIIVEASQDGMEATMTLIPPSRGDDKLDPGKIKEALVRAKITMGILYDDIQRAVKDRIENEPVVIARGKPAVLGEDGGVEFVFEGSDPAPAPDPSGQVNYKELGLVKNINQGELIARIKPPQAGEDGFTVHGRELKGKNGKAMRVKLGRNVQLSEDGKELRANSNGFVYHSGDKISVEDVYQVDQVSAAIGNIHFAGVVHVRGSVEDNFVVEGQKGIEIAGSVGRSQLRSGGDIKVLGGVIGATIEAQRDVSGKFFSECAIQAGENVIAEEYILHSKVQAGKSVRVTKVPTGFINGGVTRAGDMISSANLGSSVAEEKTHIEAGMRPNLRQQFDQTSLQLEKNQLAFDKLRKNLLILQQQHETNKGFDDQKRETFGKLIEAAQQVRQQLLEGITQFRQMAADLAQGEADQGFVFVSNTIYPGVTVQIRRANVTIKNALVGSGFRLLKGELKVQDVNEVARLYKAQHTKPPA